MITHTCPVCGRHHAVREARAAVAYGRQFTCSPECEAERRRRGRCRPARLRVAEPEPPVRGWRSLRASVARALNVWVTTSVRADLIRTAAHFRGVDPRCH